ncbi:hypothetical protein D915_004194 [Fasciola hepatica]|uniref:Uncharacterized protein n=1 Tax=Fasciola hepatica TaxID=6192 RepID=A0A4E0S1T7_FASHE|nr:hypothetical protein D915_004194 [Fasciola hepatica]
MEHQLRYPFKHHDKGSDQHKMNDTLPKAFQLMQTWNSTDELVFLSLAEQLQLEQYEGISTEGSSPPVRARQFGRRLPQGHLLESNGTLKRNEKNINDEKTLETTCMGIQPYASATEVTPEIQRYAFLINTIRQSDPDMFLDTNKVK